MSLKSQKRSNKNKGNSSSSNPLFWQKQAIRTAMFENLGATVLFFVFVIMVIGIDFFDKETSSHSLGVFLAELIIFCVFLFYGVSFVRRFAIFLKLRKIQFSNEQSISVNCGNILFLVQPESKFSSVILSIILKDESGRKFYYVYPEKNAPSDFAKKHIKEQYLGSIELVCYRDTNIVKRLPLLE